MKKIHKVFLSVVVLVLLTSGCVGSFTAFNKLKDWNMRVTDQKWANELIFIPLSVTAYPLFSLADMLVFNSVEFWTGDNPIADRSYELDGDRRVTQAFRFTEDGREMTIHLYEKGTLQRTWSIRQAGGTGVVRGHATAIGGEREDFSAQIVPEGILLTRVDASGERTIQLYSGELLHQISVKVARILERERTAALFAP
jgi:hypothetical protein